MTAEHRCAPYDRKRDDPYPQSVEQQLGAVYGPYTGTCFISTRQTDRASARPTKPPSGLFEGQVAGEALIPGEQFGLGGVHSVRGFAERELSGDDGFRASVELWPPAVPGTSLRFLLFADAGRVILEEQSSDAIASIGAGMRRAGRRRCGPARRDRGDSA